MYLREEIKAEAIVRDLAAFERFLEVAAMTDGEIVNYSNIANDCNVKSVTIKEYFSILEDTLRTLSIFLYNISKTTICAKGAILFTMYYLLFTIDWVI